MAFVPTEQEECNGMPVVKAVRRFIGGRNYVHAEPVNAKQPHYMHGGTYIKGDSRFGEYINNGGYPISLHDRVE